MGRTSKYKKNLRDNLKGIGKKRDNIVIKTKPCSGIKANGKLCRLRSHVEYCYQHRINTAKVIIRTSKIKYAGNGLYAFNGDDDDDKSVIFSEGEVISIGYIG